MAAILSTKKVVNIEDNYGNIWTLEMAGEFDASVSTAAAFEGNEIKDFCTIEVMIGRLTVARFLVYENADKSHGYYISGIPGLQADGSLRKIVLKPAKAREDIPMHTIAFHNGSERIEIR